MKLNEKYFIHLNGKITLLQYFSSVPTIILCSHCARLVLLAVKYRFVKYAGGFLRASGSDAAVPKDGSLHN